MSGMLENTKLGAVVAISATFQGFLDLIPDDIGKLTSALGVLLASLLIAAHIRKIRIDRLEVIELDLRIAALSISRARAEDERSS